MMPSFAKLIWERYSQVKAYTSRHTLTRNPARRADTKDLRRQSLGGVMDEDAAQLQHPYEQFHGSEKVGCKPADQISSDSYADIELGTMKTSEHEVKKVTTF